MQLFLVKCCP